MKSKYGPSLLLKLWIAWVLLVVVVVLATQIRR
jgi:hypothetical protein